MRPQVVIALLVFMAVGLGGVFYFKQHSAPVAATAPTEAATSAPEPVVSSPNPPADAPPVTAPVVAPATVEKIVPPAVAAAAPVASAAETPEQHQAMIDAETERLQQLSLSSDPADVPKILADLSSPEKAIREAAIQAAKQVGGEDAAAALKAAAAKASDPKEKIEMQEAADFIALPSLSSTLPTTPRTPEQIQASRQKLADFEARKQARILQENHIDPNTLPATQAPNANSASPQIH